MSLGGFRGWQSKKGGECWRLTGTPLGGLVLFENGDVYFNVVD